MLDLSIIIATRNEQEYIGNTLRFLRKCMDEAERHGIRSELIIVDSSEDETLKIARQYTDKAFYYPIKGVSKARNYGSRIAKGKVLAFMDGDTCLINPETLIKAYEYFRNPKIACVLTFCRSLNPELTLFQKLFYAYDEFFIRACEFLPLLIKFYTRGDLVLIRKDIFETVNGFNEEINVLEYTDLLNKVMKHGKIRVLPIPVYETSRRLHKWGLKTHYKYWIMAFICFYFSRSAFLQIYPLIR